MKYAKILWLDLEMTGLVHDQDLILEIAAIATDWNFKEIATFQGVIKHPTKKMLKQFLTNDEFWQANIDTKNDLIKQNKTGKDSKEVEDNLIAFIDKYFAKNRPILSAGNSVHVDRRFIAHYWPKVDKRLHYRMLDVSAWKVVFDGKYRKKYAKKGVHRALDDIRGSIEELQYYLTKLKQ